MMSILRTNDSIIEIFLEYFSTVNSDLCVMNGDGEIIAVSEGYPERHGITKKDIIGKTGADLETFGFFYPSVGKICFEKKRKVTIIQSSRAQSQILSTARPIFDEAGNIKYVMCYNAIDIADCIVASDQFNRTKEFIRQYTRGINSEMSRSRTENELNSTSHRIKNILTVVNQVAKTNATVLITGDTGTGKSLLAKTIHNKSLRRQENFVEVDCGAIPRSLIDSELFGYLPGSFTGASNTGKVGYFEKADGGTLFLDEIAELPLELQSKVLRAIQEKKIVKVGGTTPQPLDFRLIAATNKNIEDEIKVGRFREDLFYRLNVIPLRMPSLDERAEDIASLATFFLKTFNEKYDRDVVITEEALRLMELQKWPGNVRQLENTIERLVILSIDDLITSDDVSEVRQESIHANDVENKDAQSDVMSLKYLLETYEKQIVSAAYEKYGTSTAVAEHLQISQASASRKIRKYVL